MIITKILDDLLVSGSEHAINLFMQSLQEEFEIGKIRVVKTLSFAGCDIEQDEDRFFTLSMTSYIHRLQPIEISTQDARKGSTKPKKTKRSNYALSPGRSCTLELQCYLKHHLLLRACSKN